MKSRLLLVTLTLAFVFSGAVLADEAYDKVPPVHVLKVALSLSNEQVMDLRDLIKTRAKAVRAINGEIDELQAQLGELVKSDLPDPVEVGELVLDIRALKQEIGQGHEDYQQSFRELLTAMQVQRLSRINKIALADRAAEVLRDLRLH